MATFAPQATRLDEAVPPKTQRRRRRYTAEDLLRISADSSHRYELNQGNLVTMAPAGYEHGDIAMELGAQLRFYAKERGLGRVYAAETGFRLARNPDTVRAPDIGFVRQERFPVPKEQRSSAFFPGAPDLAVEVVSPDDKADEVMRKVEDWLRYGAHLVWVVYPRQRMVMVYRADGGVRRLNADDVLDGEELLPGFHCPVADVFPND